MPAGPDSSSDAPITPKLTTLQIAQAAWHASAHKGVAGKRCKPCTELWRARKIKDEVPIFPSDYDEVCPECGKVMEPYFPF